MPIQIAPVPVPILPATLPQDAIARTAAPIQAQAAPPIVQRAVDPSPKSEGGKKSKSNEKKGAGKGGSGKRGGSVNIRV